MRYEYTVTFDDFKRSIKAWRSLSRWRRTFGVIQLWLAPATMTIASLYFVYLAFEESEDRLVPYTIAGIALVVAILGVLLPRLRLRNAYNQRLIMTKGEPMFLEFDDAGIRFMVPDGADVHYKWTAFTGLHEDSRTATLFVTKAFFHSIPKSAMPEQEWQTVRARIST